MASLAPGGNDPAPPPVLTDAQGHYRLTGLGRVPHTVIAEGQRGQLRARHSQVVPDAAVDLQTQGVTALSGTATGPAGPAQVFTVTLQGPTQAVRSVTDGRFAFDHIAPGSHALYAESLAGGGVGHATVAPGTAATVDIALAANGTVTGAVVDAAGRPAAGVRVVLRDDNTAELVRPPQVTAADGSFASSTPPARTSWWCCTLRRGRSSSPASRSSPASSSISGASRSTLRPPTDTQNAVPRRPARAPRRISY